MGCDGQSKDDAFALIVINFIPGEGGGVRGGGGGGMHLIPPAWAH